MIPASSSTTALARGCASVLVLAIAAPTLAARPVPERPPTCRETAAASGKVAGDATGDLTGALTGEAFFSLIELRGGDKTLRLTLTEPQLGRWEMRFSIAGLRALPAAGDFTVTPGSSGSGGGAATGPSPVSGQLYMFDADALHGRDFVPRTGTLSLDEVDDGAICGRFDVTWTAPAGRDGGEVRTQGTFEAVDSGLGGLR
jgi:hypothetical protein